MEKDAGKTPATTAPSKKNRTPEVCTALHVVKGAAVKVLGTNLTTAVLFNNKSSGRISVQYDGPMPGPEVLKQIEDLANDKVRDNAEVKSLTMNRAEAEEKFKKEPVNGTYIYDKYTKLPEHVTEVGLVLIENWNINGCTDAHLPTTSGVGSIKIPRCNHRPQKQELEFVVEITPGTAQTAPKTAEAKAQPKESAAEKAVKNDEQTLIRKPAVQADVYSVSNQIVFEFFNKLYKELEGDAAAIAAIKAKEQKLKESFQPSLETTLCTLRNASYVSGFTAHIPSSQHQF